MTSIVIGGLAALLYLLTGGLLGVRLARAGQGHAQGKNALLATGALAALLHAVVLAHTVMLNDGVNLGFFNALSCTAWLIAVLLLAAATFRPVENLGIFLLPFAAAAIVLALIFPSHRIVSDTAQWPLDLHIVASITAYSVLTLAAVQAILLAVRDYRLRHRQPPGLLRGIPPLTTMESLLFQLIGVGFVLLSLALLTGLLFLEDIFAQHLVHKTTLSITAWIVFGILLWGRWRFGWRGRRAIAWTLGGFTALMLAYFGSKLVLELILRR
ncbi:MAG: cytochrome c biogenesis protein CcsA [Gammaproteobacteria bacterium]